MCMMRRISPRSRITPGSHSGAGTAPRNLLFHLFGLDLACYDWEYRAAGGADRARLAHLAHWPQAVDAATRRSTRSAPVAAALLDSVQAWRHDPAYALEAGSTAPGGA
jgi:hypothetical protein